jgi:uncharacterized protein YceK
MRFHNLLLGISVLLAGCATMVKGTSQQVSLDTPGYPGAECTLRSKDFGTRKVVTPANFELPKSKHDISVECRKGCARGTGTISSNLEGMTAGNIVAGGVVGFGVDAATGAMNKYNENNQIAMSQGSC